MPEPTANQLANATPGLNAALADPKFREALGALAGQAGLPAGQAKPDASATNTPNADAPDASATAPDTSTHVDPASSKKLLAGKYENVEELEKAHLELQKKLGAAKPDANGASSNAISDELIDQMNAEFGKDGKLTEDTVKRLRSAGISDKARGTIEQLVKIARDAKEKLVHNVMGGSENWGKAKQWAKDNMPVSDFQVFAKLVNSGDLSEVQAGLDLLSMKMGATARPAGSPLLKGQAAVGGAAVTNTGEARDLGRLSMGQGQAAHAATKKLLEAAVMNPNVLSI